MAEKYKPWEAPQYMQDYAATATQPFNRSMLGQKLAMEKLEEMADNDYEQPIDKNMPETGIENAVMPEEDTDMSGMGAMFKGPGKFMFTGLPSFNAGKTLLSKALPKQAAKWGIKGGLRFIPGVGWAMAAADAVDYFGYPIYDHLPGGIGDYMTWRDTTEGEE